MGGFLTTAEKRKVWTDPECLMCLVAISLDLLQRGTQDSQTQITGMKEIYKILQGFSRSNLPTDIANKMYHKIESLTRKTDLYKEIKHQSNILAKAAVEKIRPHVVAPENPRIRFRRALAAAIVGNLIDFGTTGHSIKMEPQFLEEKYQEILSTGFSIDDSNELYDILTKANQVIYLADNAGEIFFDGLLLSEIRNKAELIFVVKGAPISNDATLADVDNPCFSHLVNRIITTGSGSLGISIEKNSKRFLDLLKKTDLIICKGQSNFETLYYYHGQITKKPICFIFRTKCRPIAKFLKQTVGQNIVMLKKV